MMIIVPSGSGKTNAFNCTNALNLIQQDNEK